MELYEQYNSNVDAPPHNKQHTNNPKLETQQGSQNKIQSLQLQ